MKLTKEQAIYCANIFSNYFDPFNNIEEYISKEIEVWTNQKDIDIIR